jgi:hypothetical protein
MKSRFFVSVTPARSGQKCTLAPRTMSSRPATGTSSLSSEKIASPFRGRLGSRRRGQPQMPTARRTSAAAPE